MIEKVKNGYTIKIYKDKLELSKAVFKFIESQDEIPDIDFILIIRIIISLNNLLLFNHSI